jgi:hypothetical protein
MFGYVDKTFNVGVLLKHQFKQKFYLIGILKL